LKSIYVSPSYSVFYEPSFPPGSGHKPSTHTSPPNGTKQQPQSLHLRQQEREQAAQLNQSYQNDMEVRREKKKRELERVYLNKSSQLNGRSKNNWQSGANSSAASNPLTDRSDSSSSKNRNASSKSRTAEKDKMDKELESIPKFGIRSLGSMSARSNPIASKPHYSVRGRQSVSFAPHPQNGTSNLNHSHANGNGSNESYDYFPQEFEDDDKAFANYAAMWEEDSRLPYQHQPQQQQQSPLVVPPLTLPVIPASKLVSHGNSSGPSYVMYMTGSQSARRPRVKFDGNVEPPPSIPSIIPPQKPLVQPQPAAT
jgi:hypothetical protein